MTAPSAAELAATERWRIHVHDGHPQWLSINRGGNDTLLRTSEGHVDQAEAAAFAAWVMALVARCEQLERAMAWYDDHKSSLGVYDGEKWGDLRDVESNG